jgi:hypothetical protein
MTTNQALIGKWTSKLNDPEQNRRLDALRELKILQDQGVLAPVPRGRDVNSHIHTTYSFSPYSPVKAVWMASRAGLATAGIMDHDSISGAREFIEAGRIMEMPVTVGVECRASAAGTPLAGRRINNPDQDSNIYLGLYGVPHTQIDALAAFFKPVQEARGRRNFLMTGRLDALLGPFGIKLDYDRDVLPLSFSHDGGEVTERHLLFAAAGKMISRFGSGAGLIDFLVRDLHIPVSAKASGFLSDPDNPNLPYDLLNVLKSGMVDKFYIDADEECPPISEIAGFARDHGVILAYAYLGDVSESVTGDKKPQAFEDSYLDKLFDFLPRIGFNAVTYMPARNSRNQLLRVRALCEKHRLFQISGEDINQPRQTFICEAMRDPLFANLYDAAWALIGHENLATEDLRNGMFSQETEKAWPDLDSRVCHFKNAALKLYGLS